MENEDTLFKWSNYEAPEKKRSNDWYWALGIIALAGSVAAFIFSNFLFGVFILLSTTVLIFLSTQTRKKQSYKITENGIHIDQEFFPFEKLKGFWLSDDNDDFKLYLHTSKYLNPVITIRFENHDEGDQIFFALESHLKEKFLREPISHQVFERLGF